MKSHLAEYFSTIRRRKGIGLAQLARMIGYQNISKGSRRIDQFEKFGQIHEDLLAKLAAALEIDGHTVARLIEEDRQWTEPGDFNVPYLRVGRRRIYFILERGIPSVPTEPNRQNQKKSSPTLVASGFGAASRSPKQRPAS